ncbi:hypothetical protein MIND_00164200 [Mycena indigotica]|uniref:F-box domain-containing protein n=1 Tax=Mycena indigotica TaxID=2126181 RepID=A0A8H6TGT4_9AGAR|nr:uncharacterized protein MIND_00164200 [Mycena indigotica]KAF7316452.1 hypothetical protein MIND_00164200 [Mycena indigotica]
MDSFATDLYLPPTHTRMTDSRAYSVEEPVAIHHISLKTILSNSEFMTQHKRQQASSPVLRLPPELLSEIFLLLLATTEDKALRPSFPMHVQLALSKVCGFWRAVALHTPMLWTSVALHLGKHVSNFNGIKELALTCFQRSEPLPLSLTITSETTSMPNIVSDLVSSARHRITRLQLQMPIAFTESIFKLPMSSFKLLRSIEVSAMLTSGDKGPWFRAMSSLEGATQLKTVVFRCYNPDNTRLERRLFKPMKSGLRLEQLLHLTLVGSLQVLANDAVNLIGQATNLVQLAIHITRVPEGAPEPDSVVSSTLRYLDATVSQYSLPVFLNALKLPSLEELSVRCRGVQNIPCSVFVGLHEKSAFSLRRFLISDRMGDSIFPFLRCSPFLERVQLIQCGSALNTVCKIFTRKAGNGVPILPHLKELAIVDRWPDERPEVAWDTASQALMAMVRFRRQTGHQMLNYLVFGARKALNEDQVAQLKTWRLEGMEYRLTDLRPGYDRIEEDYFGTAS